MRRRGDVAEFLAIKPAHRDRWQLPKGTVNRGETLEQAAVREVREEGGVDATVFADLGPIHFFYRMSGRGYSKTVNFFVMKYDSGEPADHDHEVQDARWFPLDEPERLAFTNERLLVKRAREIVESGSLESRT